MLTDEQLAARMDELHQWAEDPAYDYTLSDGQRALLHGAADAIAQLRLRAQPTEERPRRRPEQIGGYESGPDEMTIPNVPSGPAPGAEERPTDDDEMYVRPDGIVEALWMRPHREFIDELAPKWLDVETVAHLHRIVDAVYEQASEDRSADYQSMKGLLGAVFRGSVPAPTEEPVLDIARMFPADPELMGSPEGDVKGLAELQDAARRRIAEIDAEEPPKDLLGALQESIDRVKADRVAPK